MHAEDLERVRRVDQRIPGRASRGGDKPGEHQLAGAFGKVSARGVAAGAGREMKGRGVGQRRVVGGTDPHDLDAGPSLGLSTS